VNMDRSHSAVKALQVELNAYHGASLVEDGVPGAETAAAYLLAIRRGGWDPASVFDEARQHLEPFLNKLYQLVDHRGTLLTPLEAATREGGP
jgi:hypothetical protein